MSAVRAEGLAVGDDGRAVLTGVELDLEPGRTLATLGTNGSGKSTLARALVGLLAPLGGRLEVLGGAPGAAPARVAFLPQSHPGGFALPPRAADVVAMGRDAARRLTGRMRADDRRLVREGLERMGVDHLAERPLADLSGGGRRRVHLAQVLAWRADLLALDEPTSGLDLGGRRALAEALALERARGAAVVISTHDIGEARGADLALLLAGRVVAAGPPGRVLTRDALFGVPASELPGERGVPFDTGYHREPTAPSRTAPAVRGSRGA